MSRPSRGWRILQREIEAQAAIIEDAAPLLPPEVGRRLEDQTDRVLDAADRVCDRLDRAARAMEWDGSPLEAA